LWHFTLTNKYNKILRPDYRDFCSWYKTVFFSVQKLKFNPPWAQQIVWLTWIYRILLLLCCVAPPFIAEMSDRKRIKTSSPTFIERTARLKNSNVSSQFFSVLFPTEILFSFCCVVFPIQPQLPFIGKLSFVRLFHWVRTKQTSIIKAHLKMSPYCQFGFLFQNRCLCIFPEMTLSKKNWIPRLSK